jgi:hypothetical protein
MPPILHKAWQQSLELPLVQSPVQALELPPVQSLVQFGPRHFGPVGQAMPAEQESA